MTITHSDDAILAALQAGAILTPAIAAEKWGCLALHSAISRIRERGHTITCTLRSENGRRFGSYRLTGENRELPAGGENTPTSYPPSQSSREVAHQLQRGKPNMGESWTASLQQSTVKSAGLPVAPVSVGLGLCSPVFQQVAHPNAAQPLRSNSRVTEDSSGGEPSGAVAAEVIHLNGKPHEVVFDGISAYDGTRYCSARPK